MYFELLTLTAALGLFFGSLVLLEAGRRIGLSYKAQEPEAAAGGLGVVEGAVYGLLGLLIAFSFSGAATRFDARRHLIAEEANVIGTAYLRLALLPAEAQPALKDMFRRYVDLRLEVFRRVPDIKAAEKAQAESQALAGEIWTDAVAASRDKPSQVPMLLLPAINEMIDITTTRLMAARMHPPLTIFAMLFGLGLISSLLGGFSMAGRKTRSGLHMFVYATVLAVSLFVILDLEYPRLGLIRIDPADQVLVQVRQGMN